MFRRVRELILLLIVCFSVSSALDVRTVVFVISTQENDFNMKLAEHLKNDIIFSSGIVYNEYPKVHIAEQDFPHFAGWAILPIVSNILKVHQNNASWVVFLQDYTSLRVHKVIEILEKYNHCEEVVVGHALQDDESTIIHHFNFHENPKSFKYPNLGPGFAVTIPILERIVKQLRKNDIYISNFSIDVAYELANYIYNDGCKAALVKHEPGFCSRYDPYCASFPQRLLPCDNMVPRNKIFFAVKTCEQHHHDRIPIVKKTWGKNVPLVKFFSNKEDSSVPTIDAGNSNVKSGYCEKTITIMKYIAKFMEKNGTDIKWIVIADDDTILGISNLQKVLSCYDYTKKMAIGERYGYDMREQSGYNYLTGGAGMVFSKPLMLEIIEKCHCPSKYTPDDMYLGLCIARMGIQVTHFPGFHQARPIDYPTEYLDTHDSVSFHKHIMIDPIEVYREWFEKSDNIENFMLDSKLAIRDEL